MLLVGRNRARLQAVAEICRARGAQADCLIADVTDRVAMRAGVLAFEARQPVDRLIVCAGILDGRANGEALEPHDAARLVLDTNLIAAVDLLHIVLPGMQARGRGEIALVSSLAALSPLCDAPAYSASKAGLLLYGLSLREALRKSGIRIVVSCPGYVDTHMKERHIGKRPGEWTAERAAAHILRALRRDRPLSGFPFRLFWEARFSLLVPEWLRAAFTRGIAFYVERGR